MSLSKKLTVLFLFFCSLSVAQTANYKVLIHNNGYVGKINISGTKLNSVLYFFYLNHDTVLNIIPDNNGKYRLNTGATIGGENNPETSDIYIYFNPSGSGQIDSIYPHESATFDNPSKSIKLNTASITINPGLYNREWIPSIGKDPNETYGYYLGSKNLIFVRGLTYTIDHFAPSCLVGSGPTGNIYYGCSNFYFNVDENGKVKLLDYNKVNAEAIGNTLKFKTVLRTISPNEISNGLPLSIPGNIKYKPITQDTQVLFIKGTLNLVYWFDAQNIEHYYYFIPL